MDCKSNAMPVNTSDEGMELQEGKDLLVQCKRTKFSVPIVPSQREVEVSDKENRVSHLLLHKASVGQDPMNGLTDSAEQSTGNASGCTEGHAYGTFLTGNQSARSGLQKICRANGWREPSYDVEEQGPPHNKLFRCKVTVHVVVGTNNIVLECFGDPKSRKKAAQEHAAQGALWYICHEGRVK